MTTFWRRWLHVWCGAVILFGMVLAGAGAAMTDGPVRQLFAILDGPGAPQWDAHMRFSTALMGCVSIGWGVTLLAAIEAAIALGQKRGRPIWTLITASILVWYLVDGFYSLHTGYWRNTLSNTLLLGGYLLPLGASGVLRR